MVTIEVNGKQVTAYAGETILSVLKREGVKVPTLCHMDLLTPTGACRMCVVEVQGMRGLVPSCSQPVTNGMKIKTHSQRAVQARRTIVELLMANHGGECLYCKRNGTCELQTLAVELGVRRRTLHGKIDVHRVDASSPSIVRDPNKCILCGKCVRTCEEIQGVSAIDFAGRGCKTVIATAFNEGLNVSSCVNCGQCIMICPTGALSIQGQMQQVMEALQNPELTVVVQHAPAISVTIAEEFGLPHGVDYTPVLNGALKRMGFDYIFDTGFTADLTIMEEASELVQRLTGGGVLPMMTSCSPGWIKFVETFYPELIPNLSTCKSPQQMMGSLIKRFWAKNEGLDPRKVFSVSIMPCSAKKFEAGRPEHECEGVPDVDVVLSTRELARLIKMHGLDLARVEPAEANTPFGVRSTAGKLFAATGGVMEAAVRTAHKLVTGTVPENLVVEPLRGLEGIKMLRLKIGEVEIGAAVVSGLANARMLMDEIKQGRDDLQFIEVMTCPGGCIDGGGQPIGTNLERLKARMKALYKLDEIEPLRTSHDNPDVQRLYKELLDHPLSEKSHDLLHTHYRARTDIPR
jgi:NADH-quinone oxidoreductase subunit G/NADP-reducing hydrogenase subunit HndD